MSEHAPKRRGPMGGHGPMGGMHMAGEKAKDFKGSFKKLLKYLGKYRVAIVIVMIFAIASAAFMVLGPKILGKAITEMMNGLIAKATEADGLVVGTPVFYAGANGALLAVLDRMFYAASARLRFKPAAAVASARRAGTTPAIDQINKYFQINCQPIVSSSYWNIAYGRNPGEAQGDGEGLHTMRVLGRNMAWMVKVLAESKIPVPETHPRTMTNFIR